MNRAVAFLFLTLAVAARAAVDFEREVAPVFRAYCAGCHNDTDLEGDFSLETMAALRTGGDRGDPIKPGNAQGSLLIRCVEGRTKPKMPPPDEPQPPAEDIAILRRWIDEGAAAPAGDRSILGTLVVADVPVPADQPVPVTAAACSPDGSLVAVATTGRVEIRRCDTGETLRTLTDLPGKVTCVEFSRDGSRLLVAGGIAGLSGSAVLFDARTGERLHEFADARDLLYAARFSPDGSLVATAGYDRIVRIRNAADGSLRHEIDEHKGAVFGLAFHPSGKILASASADSTVKLWRVADGVRLDTLNQPQGEQFAVTFTADGSGVLSAGADRRIHLWDLVSLAEPAINPLRIARFAHDSAINAIALTADGRHLLSAADDRTIKVWSLPDLVEVQACDPQPAIAAVLAPQPGTSRFLAGRMDGTSAWIDVAPRPPAAVAAGVIAVPPPAAGPPPAPDAPAAEFAEPKPMRREPAVMAVTIPATIAGAIRAPGDTDRYRFSARAGESLTLEIAAARNGSKLDSRLEILTTDGEPLEQVVLQATHDSWLTFRGKDSDTSDDFRTHRWQEMELNEFLYCNGEVVRLWHYPRGPDSGFRVYPGTGRRHTFFQTTPQSHALGQPCYIVTPLPPGSHPPPNGLPVFRLHWENDDDPQRVAGSDSVLAFTAPHDGEFVVRVSDVRGFGAPEGFDYSLSIRPRHPDFRVRIEGANPKVSPGSGREFAVVVDRIEGFDGPVRVDVANLPQGFHSSAPIVIEAGQWRAAGVLYADADAPEPTADASAAVRLTATASPDGTEKSVDAGSLGTIALAPPAKIALTIRSADGGPPEFAIRPGETISARVTADRRDFQGRINLGLDDAGRNLPHGVFVDNIGLNGLLIVESENGRAFQITASPVARPGTVRTFHLRTTADGGQCSPQATLRVVE